MNSTHYHHYSRYMDVSLVSLECDYFLYPIANFEEFDLGIIQIGTIFVIKWLGTLRVKDIYCEPYFNTHGEYLYEMIFVCERV